MSKVYVNGRSVTHQGDGQVNTCAVPDVCKTPSPGGPVPIPYVNVAKDGDLAKGSKSVNIEGNPVALKDSNLSTSSGDEPGTAGGGLISAKTKGKMTWANASIDVKIEGKGVVRFLEPTQHNGNTSNTAFAQNGQTCLAYGDDFNPKAQCSYCDRALMNHRIHEHEKGSKARAQDLANELDNLRLQGERVLKKGGKGYMFGVLACKCGDVIFAAMSGPSTEGFRKAVSKMGWNLAGDLRDQKTGVLTQDLRNGRGSLSPAAINDLDIAHLDIPADINVNQNPIPFGVCAAPKLVAAMQKSGHKPHYMTEQWYFPPPPPSSDVLPEQSQASSDASSAPQNKPKKGTVGVRYSKTIDGVTNIAKDEFKHGDSVPSCETCQVTLPALLCHQPKTC